MHSWFPTFSQFVHSSGSFPSWWPWYTTAAQRQSLLQLIAVATEEHLPLAPLTRQRLLEQESPLARASVLVKLLEAVLKAPR